MTDYKTIFSNCMQNLKNKGASGISTVEKAFYFAEEKHSGQFRKSGIPYISHPVEVMAILEKLDFSSDVLAAALLHDVVEDTGVTVAELEQNFNSAIAKIVDAVTEIRPNEKLENIEAEIKTYQKLVSMGKINRYAFYIKFADRLHNLKSLNVFARYKQVEKIKQTERFLVPLLKILKAKDFYTRITNQCFLVLNASNELDHFNAVYEKSIARAALSNQKLFDGLTQAVNFLISKNKLDISLKKIIISPKTQNEVKQQVDNLYDTKNLADVSLSILSSACTFDLFFVFSTDNYKDLIFQLFEDEEFKSLLKLHFYGFDEFSGKEYFIFENFSRTRFETFFFSQSEFSVFRNGSQDGTITDLIEEDFETEIVSDFISVKTRSNDVLTLPKGSTVLDFAFKIHNDFGFSCKYAHLNDSPSKTPIYTKLSNGDKVHLVIEEDEFGMAKNIARLKWLTYVNNEKGKKQLLKYFENLYE